MFKSGTIDRCHVYKMPQSKKLFLFDFQYFQGENAKACRSARVYANPTSILYLLQYSVYLHVYLVRAVTRIFSCVNVRGWFYAPGFFLYVRVRIYNLFLFFMYALTVRKVQYNVDLHIINILCCLVVYLPICRVSGSLSHSVRGCKLYAWTVSSMHWRVPDIFFFHSN